MFIREPKYLMTKTGIAVIGIGGGAALDVARAVALRVNHREDLFKYDDLKGGDVLLRMKFPILLPSPPLQARAVKWEEAPLFQMMKPIRKKFFSLQN